MDIDYDTREARSILAKLQAEKSPDRNKAERVAAIHKVVSNVLDSARDNGFTVSQGKQGAELRWNDAGPCVCVTVTPTGIVVGSVNLEDYVKIGHAEIVYDGDLKRWVGKEADTFLVPVPGHPVPRRSAIAVVADLIVDAAKKL